MSDTPPGGTAYRIGAAAHPTDRPTDRPTVGVARHGAPRATPPTDLRRPMARSNAVPSQARPATVSAPAVSAPAVPAPAVPARPAPAPVARAGVLATPGQPAAALRHGARHGARRAERAAPHGAPLDAQTVIARLEEAGRALLALPNTGYSTRMRLNAIEFVRSALTGEESARADASDRLRLAMPDAARISRMDEALAWIGSIPQDRYVLRRIVSCRALVSPTTERHLFTWRRIGLLIGADHKAVQRWHAQGIDMIVAALNAAR